jgi:serine/threonine protein kinase
MIVLAALVVVVIISALLHRQRGLTHKTEQYEQRDALQERLLEEAQDDLEESQAMNSRMRGAWQIAEKDVVMDPVPLASGAFGAVHAGRYGDLAVAVKVITEPLEDTPHFTGSSASSVALDFARECETLMATRHKHLLIFYGAGVRETDNRPFLVIEYMALGSLKAVLASDTELDWPVRTRIAAQIASGMTYLHEKLIVHRDLKSDNCLLNEALNAKVADFGTSKLVTKKRAKLRSVATTRFGADGVAREPVALTATMTRGVGTPLWMAPELFVVGSTYGPKVDVYSFGIILWELATRREPWDDLDDEGDYLGFYARLCDALESGQRPQLTDEVAQQHPKFVALMQECWGTAPDSRPSFKAAATLLDAQGLAYE